MRPHGGGWQLHLAVAVILGVIVLAASGLLPIAPAASLDAFVSVARPPGASVDRAPPSRARPSRVATLTIPTRRLLCVSMLLFYAAPDDLDLDAVRRRGLPGSDDRPVRLHRTLANADRAGPGPILVVDATALEGAPPSDGDMVRVPSVPPAALQNASPYRPPTPVAAAGGYVACPLPDDVALLLIHRRGVWDLPKGHRNPDEELETCAWREVREEVGIDTLHVRRSLGTTVHGYPDGDTYAIKTTHWYLMRTPERTFEPERHEGIRRVAPARWAVARRHVGYDTLRRHMDQVEPDVRAALS